VTLARLVNVRPEEVRAMLWAFAYFFCLLASYYILRPLRDEMGIAGGVRNLQWMFSATFLVMLAVVPVFGALVARFPRRVFVPWVYRFFILIILVFFALMTLTGSSPWVARVFFVWVSVFNLFVVTVFWSFMADLFTSAQGKRLFGFIAAGGTTGALLGPGVTAVLAVPLGPVNLLLISALLLEGAVQCVKGLLRTADAGGLNAAPGAPGRGEDDNDRAVGGGMLAGLVHVARSPYLLMICGHILLLTTTATFLYFQQAEVVSKAFSDPGERTRVFALIDLSVGLATLLVQLAATGRLITRFGVAPALAFMPLVTLAGFLALAVSPVLGVVIAFQAIRRAADFAITNPAREILFTVIPREDKYKAKNFMDTVVFRGGDAASGWGFAGLRGLGFDLPAIAWITVPLAAGWVGLAWVLGRRQESLARENESRTGAAAPMTGRVT
jgi:AAA family ATP:ADP antiporter